MNTYAVIGTLLFERRDKLHRLEEIVGWRMPVLTARIWSQRTQPHGFSHTYNLLINAAFSDPECECVWVLNDDVAVLSADLQRAETTMRSDPTIGLVFPTELWKESSLRDDGMVGHELVTMMPFTGERVTAQEARERGPELVEQIFGGFACCLIRRAAWEAVGPLEVFGLGYSEDASFGVRCWKAGFRVVNDRRAFFAHERGATFNTLVKEGVMKAEDPYKAAEMLKEKWPFFWGKLSAEESMAVLRGWYEEARRRMQDQVTGENQCRHEIHETCEHCRG